MILRRLRYFSSIAEHGTIVGAAKALRLAQPSLSRQIHALEREAGVALLDRGRRGIRVAPAGQVLLDAVQAISIRLEQGLLRAQQANEGSLGSLRIGLGRAALQSQRIARAIASLRTTLPNVSLEVDEIGSFLQWSHLRSDSADLMIGVRSGEPDPAIQSDALFSEVVDCVMVSSTHPLAGAQVLTPDQLSHERLLLIDPAISRAFPDLYSTMKRLHRGPVEYIGTVDSLNSLVAIGRGWAPAMRAAEPSPPAGTVVIPLKGLDLRLVMTATWRRDKRSRLLMNVLAALRAEMSREDHDAAPRVVEADHALEVRKNPLGLEARHLRALTTTIAEGSVNRAAPRLGLTQSGLSRRLRALEHEIGIPLFRRGSTGITPNQAGMAFRDDAVAILELLDNALATVRNEERGVRRPCRIGALPSEVAGELVIDMVRHMSERHPDVPVEVTELLSMVQVSALRNGDIDVGIAATYPGALEDPAIASVQIGDDIVDCALLSLSHPLASRAWLRPEELADIPFLFTPRSASPQFYDRVMDAFEQIGLAPRLEDRFIGLRAVWRLVATSMGWTVGNRLMRTRPPAGLVAIPIEGLRIPSGIRVLWRRHEGDDRVKSVLDAFRAGTAAPIAEAPLRV